MSKIIACPRCEEMGKEPTYQCYDCWFCNGGGKVTDALELPMMQYQREAIIKGDSACSYLEYYGHSLLKDENK